MAMKTYRRDDIPRCGDCRHNDGGTCEQVIAHVNGDGKVPSQLRPTYAQLQANVVLSLRVRDDFGCVLHEPRK